MSKLVRGGRSRRARNIWEVPANDWYVIMRCPELNGLLNFDGLECFSPHSQPHYDARSTGYGVFLRPIIYVVGILIGMGREMSELDMCFVQQQMY